MDVASVDAGWIFFLTTTTFFLVTGTFLFNGPIRSFTLGFTTIKTKILNNMDKKYNELKQNIKTFSCKDDIFV